MKDNLFLIPVTGEAVEEVAEATLPEKKVSEETLPKSPEDVEKEYQAKIKEIQAKAEKDISGVKSSLQKQLSDAQKQWDVQKSEYDKRIRDLEMSGLDEEDRPKYEAKMRDLEAQRLKAENEAYQSQLQEVKQMQTYLEFFKTKGVPMEKLKADGGLQELVESGWAAVTEMLEDYHKLKEAAGKKHIEAPEVITKAKGEPGGKVTWAELIKKYGSMEAVYERVEAGTLPASIVPEG